MITLPRSFVNQVRRVFSKGLGISPRRASPPVHFLADNDGLRIRCINHDVAIECRQPFEQTAEEFAIPFDALKRIEGKKADTVTLRRSGDEVTAEWTDAGIPQVALFDVVEHQEFPSVPETMIVPGEGLLTALRDASETTDREATRYAFNCLQLLGGPNGHIAATDGHQLFVQRGFQFPWEGERLIPACRAFSSTDIDNGEAFDIGTTDDCVMLRSPTWTIQLRIEKDARFPDIESHLPDVRSASSALLLAEDDARFLLSSVKRLPPSTEFNNPVTVDLNGEVAVRALGEGQPFTTELILTGSHRDGAAVRFNTNRNLLARAVRLGFRRIDVFDAEKPVCCRDQNRSYVWALLTSDGAIGPDSDAIRILSSSVSSPAANTNHSLSRKRKPPHPMSKPDSSRHTPDNNGADITEQPESTTILDQAEALKTTLQDALAKTRELTVSLKKQKKQTQLVRSTMASLRELRTVEV